MKDFTKNIKIKFDVDKANYRNFDKVMKKLTSDLKLVDNQDVKQLQELMIKFKKKDFSIEATEAKDVVARFEKLKKEGILNAADLKAFQKDSIFQKFGKGFVAQYKEDVKSFDAEKLGEKFATEVYSGIKKVGDALWENLKNAFNNLNKLLDYSLLTNDNTYKLWEKGLTGAEAYAYDQANSLIGISDFIEDSWKMTDAQREKWFETYNKQQERYTQLYDSGYFDELQQFQWEMKEFQQDVEYEFMRIIMDNKDTIMWFFELGIDFMEWTVKTLGDIARKVTGRERSELERSNATSDVIKKYTSQTQNTAVTIDNTWNIKGSTTESRNELAKNGQLTYEQVIRALGGTLN